LSEFKGHHVIISRTPSQTSMPRLSRPCLSRASSNSSCRSRDIISRNPQRSSTNDKIQCGLCPKFCVFCEIWKLVTLLRSRVQPLNKRPTSMCSSASSSSQHWRGSASYQNDYSSETRKSPVDDFSNEKLLDALFMLKGPRLASMLSLCTLDEFQTEVGLHSARRPVQPPRGSTYWSP